MSGYFFDGYPAFYGTSQTSPYRHRLGKRHQVIIEQNAQLIRGRKVLDLACHDGRWSFAALKAGASHVTGIEGRQHLVDNAARSFAQYGVPESSYRFIVGDVVAALGRERIAVDTVLLLGFFYHVINHLDLVGLIERTGARSVIIDTAIVPRTETALHSARVIQLIKEPTQLEMNSTDNEWSRNGEAMVGVPSTAAVHYLFEHFGFRVKESDWSPLLQADHHELIDYKKEGRATFVATR